MTYARLSDMENIIERDKRSALFKAWASIFSIVAILKYLLLYLIRV